MAKTSGGKLAWAPVSVGVELPADAGLARLLTGSGSPSERLINCLAIVADPGYPIRTVELPAGEAAGVGHELAALLARAREAGDPAADALAAVAAQLGVRETAAATTRSESD